MSKADILEWRTQTISCARKLDPGRRSRRSSDVASDIVKFLSPAGPVKGDQLMDAEKSMTAICDVAVKAAVLFRSSTVSYIWLQRQSTINIPPSEREIIGSASPGRRAEDCSPWIIVFGGVVKNEESQEDKLVLRKSELLVQ